MKALKSMALLTPEIMKEIDEVVGDVNLDPARQDESFLDTRK